MAEYVELLDLPGRRLMPFSSLLMGAPTAGWMEYPPVSLQGGAGTSMWAAAIFLVGIGSTMTGLNFIVTFLKMRAPGMTFTRMPLFCWGSRHRVAVDDRYPRRCPRP